MSALRLLADEGVPRRAVDALRAGGHDVRWIAEEAAGENDLFVADLAISEGRVLLTLDKDFGDLAYRDRRAMPRGVVLVRIDPQTPREVTALFLRALADGPVEGHFVVATPEQIRRRRLA